MRIALAQLNPTSGDIDGNTEKIIDALARASALGADLLVTPEMAVPGYCIGDLVEDAAFLEANERAVQQIARAARGITAVVGFIDFDAGARNDSGTILKHNAAAVVRDGTVLQRAHKSLLPNYRYFDDKRFFTPAACREPVEVPLGVAAVGHAHLCALASPSARTCGTRTTRSSRCRSLPQRARSVLLNINASPFYPGKRHERDALIRRHIERLRKPFVYVNTAGAADNGKNIIPFDGESLAYDAHGRSSPIAEQFTEQVDGRRGARLSAMPGRAQRPRASLPPAVLAPVAREREMYDALVMALARLHAQDGLHATPLLPSQAVSTPPLRSRLPSTHSARNVSRHSTCRRGSIPTRRSRSRNGCRARLACSTASSPFRRSTTRCAGCSRRTRTRSPAVSRGRTSRPGSVAC